MVDNSSEQLPEVTRRKTLQTIGSGSAVITSIPGTVGATTTSRTDDSVTITTVKGNGKPKVRKQVPADWWEYEQHADQVRQQLFDRYESVIGIKSVSLGTLDERISGRMKSSVNISVYPSGANVSLPDNVEGVPVRVTEAKEPELMGCNKGDFEYVPGGVAVDEADYGNHITSTCKVERDGITCLMSCAHHWSCDDDLSDESLFQSGQYVGDLYTWDRAQDWVIASEASDSEISGFINHIEDNTGEQCGHVTRDGLFDLKSAGTTVYQQGISTCKTEHKVDEVDDSAYPCDLNCHRYVKVRHVSSDDEFESGDSGGPIFHQYKIGGEWKIAIIAPTRSTTSNYGWGCAAYWIHDDRYVNFDPDNCS